MSLLFGLSEGGNRKFVLVCAIMVVDGDGCVLCFGTLGLGFEI